MFIEHILCARHRVSICLQLLTSDNAEGSCDDLPGEGSEAQTGQGICPGHTESCVQAEEVGPGLSDSDMGKKSPTLGAAWD